MRSLIPMKKRKEEKKKMKIKFWYPRGNFPRLCLIGNSNVGKSSLTKQLLSHPQWYKGKIGATAGSTVRLMLINDPSLNYHVIDLPGFGKMARLSRTSESYIQKQILKYVELDKRNIFLMILVVSAERLGDELEKWYFNSEETVPLTIEFVQYLQKNEIPTMIALNKIDKLNRYQKEELKNKFLQVLEDFEIEIQSPESKVGLIEILETSMKDKTGLKELKKIVKNRASKLNMDEYDSRKDLLNFPTIDQEKPREDGDTTRHFPKKKKKTTKKTAKKPAKKTFSKSSKKPFSKNKKKGVFRKKKK
jgi:GTP-binding protein EngB required for normal cell division